MAAEKKVLIEVRIKDGTARKSKKTIGEVTAEIKRLEAEQKKYTRAVNEARKRGDPKAEKENAARLAQTRIELDANKRAFNNYKNDVVKGARSINYAFRTMILRIAAVITVYRLLEGTVGVLVKNFKEFEQSLVNIQTLLDETDGTIRSNSLEIMRKYGFQIKDTNKALFDSISAGIAVGDSLQFMNEAAQLAIGGVTDLSTAVDGMTSIMNAYQLEVDESNKISSAFFQAQKFGKTTVAELSSNIGKVAPIAALADVSYQQLLATISELTLGGLNTEESITALRQAINGLIAPAKEAIPVLEKYAVPFGLANVKAAGLTYSLQQLSKAAEENPDALSGMITNIRAFTAAAALTGDRLDHLNMVIDSVNENFGDGSSLSLAYQKQMATLAKQTDIWSAEIREITILMGEKLKPVIIWFMRNWKTLAEIVGSLASAVVGYYTVVAIASIRTKTLLFWTNLLRGTTMGLLGATKSLVGALAALVGWYGINRAASMKSADATSKMSAEINTAREELNYLFEVLKKQKEQNEDYAGTIKEINSKYGKYLENLMTEKTTLEGIEKAREGVLDLMLKEMQAKGLKDVEKEKLDELKNAYENLTVSLKDFDNVEGDVAARDALNDIVSVFSDDTISKEMKMEKFSEFFDKWVDKEKIKSIWEKVGENVISVLTNIPVNLTKGSFQSDLVDAIIARKEWVKAKEDYAAFLGLREKETIDYYNELIGIGERFRDLTEKQLSGQIKIVERKKKEESDVFYKGEWGKFEKALLALRKYKEQYGKESDEVIQKEQDIVTIRQTILADLSKTQRDQIDEFNFLFNKTLTYEKKLTDQQVKDLVKKRKEFQRKQFDNEVKFNDKLRKIRQKIEDDQVDIMSDSVKKQLTLAKLGYERRIENIQDNYKKIKNRLKRERDDRYLTATQFDRRMEELRTTSSENALAAVMVYNKKVNDVWEDYYRERNNLIADFDSKIYDEMETFRQQIAVKYGDIRAELEDAMVAAMLDGDLELLLMLQKRYNDLFVAETEEAQDKMFEIRKQYGIATNREIFHKELRDLQRLQKEKLISEEEFLLALKKLKDKYKATGNLKDGFDVPGAEELEIRKFISDKSIEIAQNTANEIFQINREADQREFQAKQQALQRQYDAEMEILNNRLEAGVISEAEYREQQTKLQEKQAAEEEALQRRQFEREKDMAVQEAIINGLVAIAKTWASAGFPIGIPLSIAMEAINATIIAAIKSSATFAKGGMFEVGGKPHSQGGTRYVGSDGNAFEAERDEVIAVVNKTDSATLKGLSDINSIHGKPFFRDGGGVVAHNNNYYADGGVPVRSKIGVDYSGLAKAMSNVKIVASIEDIINKRDSYIQIVEEANV